MCIVGLILVRIQSRADQWAALSDELQEGKATALSALARLIIDAPGDYEGHNIEESNSGGIDGDVSNGRGKI